MESKVADLLKAFKSEMQALSCGSESDQIIWPFIQSTEVAIENHSPGAVLSWLRRQDSGKKVFWADRERNLEIAGVNFAHKIQGDSLDELNAAISLISRVTATPGTPGYLGGVCFNTEEPFDDLWIDFHRFTFVLPMFELRTCNSGFLWLRVNAFIGDRSELESAVSSVEREFSKLNFEQSDTPLEFSFSLASRTDEPIKEKWVTLIEAATHEIKSGGDLKKIVLARKTQFDLVQSGGRVSPIDLLVYLAESDTSGFTYYIQLSEKDAFLGKSPERLYKRTGDGILCEALAGTARIGRSAEEELLLKNELFLSDKDSKEHSFVVNFVQDVLSRLCTDFKSSQLREIKRHFNVQHLLQQFSGTLRPELTDYNIITSFSPTPAVGGVPTVMALNRIDDAEAFRRGWYAGAFGMISQEETEFCVSLRCALYKDHALHVFTGVGIVADSDPVCEWEEMENKMSHFIQYSLCN